MKVKAMGAITDSKSGNDKDADTIVSTVNEELKSSDESSNELPTQKESDNCDFIWNLCTKTNKLVISDVEKSVTDKIERAVIAGVEVNSQISAGLKYNFINEKFLTRLTLTRNKALKTLQVYVPPEIKDGLEVYGKIKLKTEIDGGTYLLDYYYVPNANKDVCISISILKRATDITNRVEELVQEEVDKIRKEVLKRTEALTQYFESQMEKVIGMMSQQKL